jgi:hypothetical protein
VFSKNFLKSMYDSLLNNFSQNAILNPYQYGFRSKLSTENASHKLLNEILTAVNQKEMVGEIFCDLYKAFDYINHTILLEIKTLWRFRKILNLVESYIDGSHHKGTLGHNEDAESTWKKIKRKVSQGSILGPISFSYLHK